MRETINIAAHQIALDVNNVQASQLRQHCGAARVAYNHALRDCRDGFNVGEWRGDMTLRKRFNAVKYEECPWMDSKEISMNAGKNAIVNAGVAFKNWSDSRKKRRKGRKVGFPQFKSIKRSGYKYQADNGVGSIKVDGQQVKLPAIGWLRMREEPRFSGDVRKAFIKCKGGRWFITLTFQIPADPPIVEVGEKIGIDVGLKSLATLSDGTKYETPKALKRMLGKLRHLNKELSRRVKGSNRRKDTQEKLAKLHYRVACLRNDHLHKVIAEITNRAGLAEIVMETLNIAGMMKNRRVARAFADAGIAEFMRQIEYKSRWKGIAVSKADRFYPSSKKCHACGVKNDTLRLSQREWRCGHCNVMLDRDWRAAINLKECPQESLAARSAVPGRGEPVSLEQLASEAHRSVNSTDYPALAGLS